MIPDRGQMLCFGLLFCTLLSTPFCESVLDRDETSLIQTRNRVEHGTERLQVPTNTLNAPWLGIDPKDIPDITKDAPNSRFGLEASNTVRATKGVVGSTSWPRCMATANLALMSLSVPGDFVETGVYQGSTSIMMAKILKNHDPSRTHWAADSFMGLPSEDTRENALELSDVMSDDYKNVKGGLRMGSVKGAVDYNSARQIFENNLEVHGLGNSKTNPKIQVLQGYFNETLPKAPIGQISFLRLDGDLYVSTKDALEALYDKVSPGGYIYVNNYGYYIGCKHAIDEFRQARNIEDVMYPVMENNENYVATWWQKTSDTQPWRKD